MWRKTPQPNTISPVSLDKNYCILVLRGWARLGATVRPQPLPSCRLLVPTLTDCRITLFELPELQGTLSASIVF
jgi:hypothetical protein